MPEISTCPAATRFRRDSWAWMRKIFAERPGARRRQQAGAGSERSEHARAESESHRCNRNPRPQPQTFSKWGVSNTIELLLHLSKLVIWGSSLGRGFRFHCLERPSRPPAAVRPLRLRPPPQLRASGGPPERRSTYLIHASNAFPDPGALNCCMHTFRDKKRGIYYGSTHHSTQRPEGGS